MFHEKQWEFLKRTFEEGKLSHAYLFSGETGIGKKDFAKNAKRLFNMKNFTSKIEKIVVTSGLGKLAQQAQFKDKLLPEILKEFAIFWKFVGIRNKFPVF